MRTGTMTRSAALAALALAAGCASVMNTNTAADVGPVPAAYEQTVRAYLRSALRDPASMTDFAVSAPERTSCAVGVYGPFHGWRVAVQYNAKNAFGGYVGLKTTYYWFHGEQLRGVSEQAGYCPEAPGWR